MVINFIQKESASAKCAMLHIDIWAFFAANAERRNSPRSATRSKALMRLHGLATRDLLGLLLREGAEGHTLVHTFMRWIGFDRKGRVG